MNAAVQGEFWALTVAPEPPSESGHRDGMDRTDAWFDDAACARLPLTVVDDFFFPANGNYVRAQEVCLGCPVRRECAEAGAAEKHGVWGGTTPAQRGADGAAGNAA